MDLDFLLNTLKWQLIARLPGGSICERVKKSINSDIERDDPLYYVYWMDINKSRLKKFVLGTFCTNNSDYIEFIRWLDENYKVNK